MKRRKNRAKPLAKSPKNTQKLNKKSNKSKNRLTRLKPRVKMRTKALQIKSPTIELGTVAFKTLQADWYKRLKADGYKDIESLNCKDGLDGLLSTRGAQPQARFQDAALTGRETYYRRLTNFVTHNPNWSHDKLANYVATLYIDGISYRKMLPLINTRLKIETNIWRVHNIVKALEARSKVWNKVHPEGLDFVSDFESIAE